MKPGLTRKILSAVLLLTVALLVAFSIEHNSLIVKLVKYTNEVSGDETIHIERYSYGKTTPIILGAIKNPHNAYVDLKLRFRADSTEGYPNVFQTAPVNRGMRMETSGSTAAIIVPNVSVPGGAEALILNTALKTGQWYELEIEALNGAYVRAKLDGHSVVDYVSSGLAMETSQIMIGGGFDESRTFRGVMENVSVTKGHHIKYWNLFVSFVISISIIWIVKIFCVGIFDIVPAQLRALVMSRVTYVGVIKNIEAKTFIFYGALVSILSLYSIYFTFPHHVINKTSGVFSVFFGLALIYVAAKYILNLDVKLDKKTYTMQLLRNLSIILISLLVMQKYNTYEFRFSTISFFAGFPFGNFTDFYASSTYSFTGGWSNALTANGYFPLANLIGMVFGYLMGWNGVILNQKLAQVVYLIFFIACFAPIAIKLARSSISNNTKFYFVAITFLSYPVLFLYERGNYVLITFFLLQIYFLTKHTRLKLIMLSLIFSLKLLNLIFIPLLFKKSGKQALQVIGLSCAIQLTSILVLSFIYGHLGLEVIQQTITNAMGGSNFTDGMKMIAGGGIDAVYVSINHLLNGQIKDGYSEIKNLRLVGMPLVAVLMMSYFYKTRSYFSEVKYVVFSILLLYIFHPLAVDYNLIIIYLVFAIVVLDESLVHEQYNRLVGFLSLYLIGFYFFPIVGVACCGEPAIPGKVVPLTIRPFVLLFLSLIILWQLWRSPKNPVLSSAANPNSLDDLR